MFNVNRRYIYLYVCIVFSMVCSRACLRITLVNAMNWTFHSGGSRRKGNIKRRREQEREARQNESEKEEARLEVRIIAS